MDFLDKIIKRIKLFLRESRRVILVTRKPDSREFKTIVKVAGMGMIVIGFIGFVIQMIKQIFLS